MCIKLLKLLFVTESTFGVHRNYCLLSKFKKLLTWFQIFIEIILIMYSIISYQFNFHKHINKQKVLFIVYAMSSCLITILALYHSKNFKKLICSIKNNHHRFISDTVYTENLSRIYKQLIFLLIIYYSLRLVLETYTITVYWRSNTIDNILILIYSFYFIVCKLRFGDQYVLTYVIMFLLSEHIKCIIRRLSKERNLKSVFNEDEDNNEIEVIPQDVTSFDDWTTLYMDIKECSDLFNMVFGVQVSRFSETVNF